MVVLRSREILPTDKRAGPDPQPTTPAQNREPFPASQTQKPRRSLRLASLPHPSPDSHTEGGGPRKRRRKDEAESEQNRARGPPLRNEGDFDCCSEVIGILVPNTNPNDKEGSCSYRGSSHNGEKESEERAEDAELGFRDDGFLNAVENVGLEARGGDSKGKGIAKDVGVGNLERICRFSSEEKGKGIVVEKMEISETEVGNLEELEFEVGALDDDLAEVVERVMWGKKNRGSEGSGLRMEQYKDVARKNASRFAYFDREEDTLPPEHGAGLPAIEERQVEDWPGPFSTAMKIIRDRANKLNSIGASTFGKPKSVPIMWVPKKEQGCNSHKVSVPSLQELCLVVLVKNADEIPSLESVPDALRHRLCHLLCDSQKMNGHFLNLLVQGSPTEIQVKDCSWLSDEVLTNCFEDCDTRNLTILQLDQCGRCMADYTLPTTLACSPCSLPVLTALSLGGACRLSDVGLKSLVAGAPNLRSVNLSQCSFITSNSINNIAYSLGSTLRELYIDECQGINAILILPALKKIEHLEVLSLAGIQSVCDDFVIEFVVSRGHNIKKLVLADCVNLTDSSLRVIAETCPRLCSISLLNVRKLTDSALGYLANGCREIQTLKLCRNEFSDEAIAAYIETSGERLKELSLNNVKKVDHNSALSLSKCARNLSSLDLSWCRNLSDEALGLIVDSCSSLRLLKLFGCTQITNLFLEGHSNPEVEIIGLRESPLLEHRAVPDSLDYTLRYSSVYLC